MSNKIFNFSKSFQLAIVIALEINKNREMDEFDRKNNIECNKILQLSWE